MATDIRQVLPQLLEETLAKGNVDAYDAFCGPGYRSHDPLGGEMDLAHAKEACRMLRTAFPDISITILGSYADGDTAIVHWRMAGTHEKSLFGIVPTGKRLTVEGITIGKFRDGKLIEDFTQWDALGVLRELGLAQAIAAGATPGAARPQPTPNA